MKIIIHLINHDIVIDNNKLEMKYWVCRCHIYNMYNRRDILRLILILIMLQKTIFKPLIYCV